MKHIAMCLLVFVLAWSGAIDVAAQTPGGFRVIVHPENSITTITRAELANIYLRRSTRWSDGSTVRPVDQVRTVPVREAFSRAVLDRSVSQMLAYWQQQIFSGRGVPPTEMVSDATVLLFVQSHPGAVGYISAGADTRGVRVLEIVP